MPVEPLENGHFVLFWSFLACFWQNKWFSKDYGDLTAQYFLLSFGRLIQVNKKHLLASFPASTYFFFQMLKMAIRTKTSSRPQLSLKLVHTKGSVIQLHSVKEYTTIFRLQEKYKKITHGLFFCFSTVHAKNSYGAGHPVTTTFGQLPIKPVL